MAGLDPAISFSIGARDARVKPAHDDVGCPTDISLLLSTVMAGLDPAILFLNRC
jgi:hypothetical protein